MVATVVESLREVAHHEAAHVVVGNAVGCGITAVTIVECEDYRGLCTFEPFPAGFQPDMYDAYDEDDPTQSILERQILATMAGGIAGHRVTGEYDAASCDSDLKSAMNMLCYLTGDPGDLQPAWDALWARSEALVAEHWGQIVALAELLLVSNTLDRGAVASFLGARQPTIAEQWASGLAEGEAEGAF